MLQSKSVDETRLKSDEEKCNFDRSRRIYQSMPENKKHSKFKNSLKSKLPPRKSKSTSNMKNELTSKYEDDLKIPSKSSTSSLIKNSQQSNINNDDFNNIKDLNQSFSGIELNDTNPSKISFLKRFSRINKSMTQKSVSSSNLLKRGFFKSKSNAELSLSKKINTYAKKESETDISKISMPKNENSIDLNIDNSIDVSEFDETIESIIPAKNPINKTGSRLYLSQSQKCKYTSAVDIKIKKKRRRSMSFSDSITKNITTPVIENQIKHQVKSTSNKSVEITKDKGIYRII